MHYCFLKAQLYPSCSLPVPKNAQTSRDERHKPKVRTLQFQTPKMLVIQFHISNIWKNANHTIFIQNFKKLSKKDSH